MPRSRPRPTFYRKQKDPWSTPYLPRRPLFQHRASSPRCAGWGDPRAAAPIPNLTACISPAGRRAAPTRNPAAGHRVAPTPNPSARRQPNKRRPVLHLHPRHVAVDGLAQRSVGRHKVI